jgi:hypothetical protein
LFCRGRSPTQPETHRTGSYHQDGQDEAQYEEKHRVGLDLDESGLALEGAR